MRLTEYEKHAQREIDRWQHGESSFLQQAIDFAMKPVDWAFDQVIPDELIDRLSDAIIDGLGVLNDASAWTYEEDDVLEKARARGLDVNTVDELRDRPLEELDPIAQDFYGQNAILAAIEGGGTSLGGPLFIAADIPLLFTINFRVIQQIGGAYGFPLRKPEFQPLVVAIYNVAASGSREAKQAAVRELSVAAAAFAHDTGYKGRRVSGTFRDQNRHVPRELAKNLAARKLGQLIPVAGAAIGAGVNYWFTDQTARTATMLFRSLYLERKERL